MCVESGWGGSSLCTVSHPPARQSRLVHLVPETEWKLQDLLKCRHGAGTLPLSHCVSQSKSQASPDARDKEMDSAS